MGRGTPELESTKLESQEVYIWADVVYFNIRSETAKQCILVIIGVAEQGREEFIAIEDGYRELDQSRSERLLRLKAQGVRSAPKLAVGDGTMGSWKALCIMCSLRQYTNAAGCIKRQMY